MDAIQKVCLGRVNIKHLFILSMQMEVKDMFKCFPRNKHQDSKNETLEALLWKRTGGKLDHVRDKGHEFLSSRCE